MAMQTMTLIATHLSDISDNVYAPYVRLEINPVEYPEYVNIEWLLYYCADDTYYPTNSFSSNYTIYIGDNEITGKFLIGEEGGERQIRHGNCIVYKDSSVFKDIELYLFFAFDGAMWHNPYTNSNEALDFVEAKNIISIPYIGFDPNDFELWTYEVFYNKNYGNYADYGSFIKVPGEDYQLSFEPTRKGYRFLGWDYFMGGEDVDFKYNDVFNVDENGTLYAIWEPLSTYTITYDTNGGSESPPSQEKIEGVMMTLSDIIPTKDGYKFMGWTKSFEDSIVYQPSEGFNEDGDTTLYAVWFPVSYTITYDANGGKGAPSNQKKYHGFNVTVMPYREQDNPYRTGYKFMGWSTTQNGNVEYLPNDSLTLNESITLYAVWEKSISNLQNIQLYRCDAEGNKQIDGTNIKVVFDYTRMDFVTDVVIGWRCDTDYEEYVLSNSIRMEDNSLFNNYLFWQHTIVIDRNFNNNKKYTFRVMVYDTGCEYNQEEGAYVVVEEATLSNVNYFMDFKPPTSTSEIGGVGIGKEAENDGVLDIGLKTRFLGGILYTDISNGTNFNTLTTPNSYAIINDGTKHGTCPISTDGTLFVEPVGTDGDVRQVVKSDSTTCEKYERYYKSAEDAWSQWRLTYSADFGRIYTNTTSVQITTGSIDKQAIGATITVPKGFYVVNGLANFATGTSSGNRNNQIRLYAITPSNPSKLITQERNYAAAANFLSMNISCIYEVTEDNTQLCITKSSSIVESSDASDSHRNTTITAIRIA